MTYIDTLDAAMKVVAAIQKSLDESSKAGCLFLDIKKAFDCVNHEIILKKLKLAGMSEATLDWTESYLSDRWQRVLVNDTMSNPKLVRNGVPQGSVLGPLLFSIAINKSMSTTRKPRPFCWWCLYHVLCRKFWNCTRMYMSWPYPVKRLVHQRRLYFEPW